MIVPIISRPPKTLLNAENAASNMIIQANTVDKHITPQYSLRVARPLKEKYFFMFKSKDRVLL